MYLTTIFLFIHLLVVVFTWYYVPIPGHLLAIVSLVSQTQLKLTSFPLALPSACEDGSTPAAVAESAAKVLNTCLAAMPAGRPSHPLFLRALQN